MIKVDRTRIPPPKKFLKTAEAEAQRAVEFYSDPDNLRYGKPFPHRAYRLPDVREALGALFYHKCAFCESKLEDFDPGLFRPRDMATNYNGAVTRPGYWWLAWEWSNLYPICPQCLSSKASRFPVEGPRATFEQPGSPKQLGDIPSDPLHIQAITANDWGVFFVTGDGTLFVYDLDTGRIKSESKIPLTNPTLISVDPEGRVVAIASEGGVLVVLHFSQRYLPRDTTRYEIDQPIRSIDILPDGKRVVVASDNNLIIWDIGKNSEIQSLQGASKPIPTFAVSPDGLFAVTGSDETTLAIWSLESQQHIRTLHGHEKPVVGARIAGNKVVSLSERGFIRVWDIESGENLFTVGGYGSEILSFELSADGRYAICREPFRVRVVDLYTRTVRVEIGNLNEKVELVTLTPNGKYFLTYAGKQLRAWHLDPVGGEQALLLDPCQDEIADLLIFSDDGLVAANPARKFNRGQRHTATDEEFSDISRAQITIDTFGLNRLELVDARRKDAHQLHMEVKKILQNDPTPIFDSLLEPGLPFIAMRRQLLPKYIQEISQDLPPLDTPVFTDRIEQQVSQYAVQSDIFEKAFKSLEELTIERQETPIKDLKERDFFKRSALISKIVIDNFRCIQHLEFDFTSGSENQSSWKVLLGENGAGKSSILEAVALTLMDQDRLEKIPEIKKGSLLKRGERRGSVQVFFITENLPVELELSPTGPVHKYSDSGLHTYLLGFGSARWLPLEGSQLPETDAFVRVRNLFNPFVPLTDAIEWLKNLKAIRAIKKYRKVELVLTRLLQLAPGTRFPLRDGVIYVRLPDRTISESERLNEMSDGYQTVLAIAITIMDMLGELWDMEMEAAEGLVLLDEIGAHLHPRWKMKIVDSLRSAFPRMQFLATTHEPLCLRGLKDNEILLLRKIEHKVRATPIIDSPDTLTTDQLLRSPLFGLLTTFDPDTDRDLEKYSNLLSKPEDTRSDDEKRKLEGLRERLGQTGILAEMARKQVIHGMLADSIPKPETFDPDEAS